MTHGNPNGINKQCNSGLWVPSVFLRLFKISQDNGFAMIGPHEIIDESKHFCRLGSGKGAIPLDLPGPQTPSPPAPTTPRWLQYNASRWLKGRDGKLQALGPHEGLGGRRKRHTTRTLPPPSAHHATWAAVRLRFG